MTNLRHDHHLNDEQLSAHLDGQGPDAPPAPGTDSVESHLAACGDCRRRLEALGRARALLRRPVAPVAPSRRAAAVQAAVANGLSGAEHDGAAIPALHSRRPPSRLLVGAAAAVAVLVVGVAVALGLSHAPSSTPTSASATGAATSAPHRSSSSASASAPTATATAPPITALGSLSSASALKARLTPLLSRGDFNVQGQAAQDAPESAGAPAATGPPAATSAGTTALSARPLTACLAQAQQAAGPKASVVLVATATYDHQAALVVVSTLPASTTAGATRVAVVVARTGCRVLERTDL